MELKNEWCLVLFNNLLHNLNALGIWRITAVSMDSITYFLIRRRKTLQ
jgi:hypothetical protein